MSRQASLLSVGSMEDCWSENEGRPMTTCWPGIRRSLDDSKVRGHLQDDASDFSLQSCNSTDRLKQWTMRYPVTACCQPACAQQRHRRQRRRRRRLQSSFNSDSSDDESIGETEVDVMYTDCNGVVRCCQQPVCIPRKPCTLVGLNHISRTLQLHCKVWLLS